MPTLRKIKRGVLPTLKPTPNSTFNFARHTQAHPPPDNVDDCNHSGNLFAQFKIFIVILQYKYKDKDVQE